MKFASGNVYEGDWRDGIMNGQGAMRYRDRGYYEGDWRDGKRSGQGMLRAKNGNYCVGRLGNDLPDGQGKAVINGKVYEGTWQQGCFHENKYRANFGVAPSNSH